MNTALSIIAMINNISERHKAEAANVSTPWDKFKRTHAEVFYGCVDKDGKWFDSAEDYSTAIHWCAMHYDLSSLSPLAEVAWMESEGLKIGLSVIHSTLLRKMYEAGLIK